MRFLAGLRLVLIAVVLIGLLAGQSVVFPIAVTHATTMTTVEASHDCCDKTSTTPFDKAGAADACLDATCSVAAPALLPAVPVVIFRAERQIATPVIATSLEGVSPSPLLEPPRA